MLEGTPQTLDGRSGRVPQTHSSIRTAGGEQVSVRAKCQGLDGGGVFVEHERAALSKRRPPQPDLVVGAPDRQLTPIWTEGHTGDQASGGVDPQVILRSG